MILVTDKNNIPQFVDSDCSVSMGDMISSIKTNFPDWEITHSQWRYVDIKSNITGVEVRIYIISNDNLLLRVLGEAGKYHHVIGCK